MTQTIKEYFTQEGLSLCHYQLNYLNQKLNLSFSYFGEESFCDREASAYYHNTSGYKYYFYFEEEKMYLIHPSDCALILFYDFGLAIGESVPSGKYAGYMITDIYPVTLLNGEERMRFDLKKGGIPVSWIVGIGDIINGNDEKLFEFETSYHFVCAKLGDVLLWAAPEESELCDIYSCLQPKVKFEIETNDFSISTTNSTLFADTYEWDFGDGFTSTEENPSHTYDSPGCYNVALRAFTDCKEEYTERTQKASICVSDAWDLGYRIDSLPNMKVYKFSEQINYVYYQNTVLKTIDGGNTWTNLSMPSQPMDAYRFIFNIQFYNENDGIINCGYSGFDTATKAILVTHDGGLTWQEKVEGSIRIYNLTIGKNGEAWATPDDNKNYLFRSLDYGKNWETIYFQGNHIIRTFTYIDQNTLIGLGYVGDLPFGAYRKAVSYDKGTTWEFIEFEHNIYGGTYFTEQLAYRVIDEKLHVTEDGGATWNSIETDLAIQSILFSSPTHGWITDIYNTVYYTSNGLHTYESTNCDLGPLKSLLIFNDTLAYGTLFDNPPAYQTGTQLVTFNKRKLGACFSITDLDGDGFTADVDCDDSNPEVNPDMEEIPNNMIDDNCNGMVDENNTSLSEENTLFISVFPNPVHDFLYVDIPHRGNWKNKLCSIHGKTIVASDARDPLDVSQLQKGVYVLKIISAQNEILGIKKVVLQ
ncbi:MAG: PKD domain-containing protein [Saprospiraceae bacterium]|nr:PKD domain-containing protein [Saprospiraceae bacterium]